MEIVVRDGELEYVSEENIVYGKYKVPENITSIGKTAFTNSSLEQIILPEGLKSIGISAFSSCKELTEIDIPDSVIKIGSEAFIGCSKLERVKLPKSLKFIGGYAFSGSAIKDVVLPEGVEEVGKRAFMGALVVSVKLNDLIEIIPDNCFFNCKQLEEVEFGKNVKIIDEDAFYGCISLKKVTLPKNLKVINGRAFALCDHLTEVDLGESLLIIDNSAFYNCMRLEKIKIPESVKVLGDDCFKMCANLKYAELPSNLETIGTNVFGSCYLLDYYVLNGKTIEASYYMKRNLDLCYDFLNYATKNNLFIPKNTEIMGLFSSNRIGNFYMCSKEWAKVLTMGMKKWKDDRFSLNHYAENLCQACIMLGLFEGGIKTKEAMQFVEENIIEINPNKMHERFGSLNVRELGYNEEFAKFYMKNYTKDESAHFLQVYDKSEDSDWIELFDYTASAYNNWAQVKEAYPNKTVIADREHASENNNLTPEDVINALMASRYENVHAGNEEMVEMVCRYGYSQEDFDELQDLYEKAKNIDPEQMILRAEADDENVKGVKYSLLAKDDPEALILGEKTNCCQTINNAGRSCVKYGETKENSGFVKFSLDGKIVGQSWVWYNKDTGVVCLDNIEIPTVWLKKLKNKEFENSFIDCLTRTAKAFKREMGKCGYVVKAVTIGAGYNDLSAINKFKKINARPDMLPKDYDGYSDATEYQYIIPIAEKIAKRDEEIVR